jgi:hypothetical protein
VCPRVGLPSPLLGLAVALLQLLVRFLGGLGSLSAQLRSTTTLGRSGIPTPPIVAERRIAEQRSGQDAGGAIEALQRELGRGCLAGEHRQRDISRNSGKRDRGAHSRSWNCA